MKFYYAQGACSLVVRIILNELGLKFDANAVNLKTKELDNGDNFKAINPKGSVPVLELDNGDFLTENAVILQYLADNYSENLLPRLGYLQRYRILEWLNFITTELHKGFSILFNKQIPSDIKKQIIIPGLEAKFQYIDRQLEDSKYLSGDYFTLPDPYLYVMLRWAKSFNFKNFPHLNEFFILLESRKSVIASLEQEGLTPIPIEQRR